MRISAIFFGILVLLTIAGAALVEPPAIKMPGTQPGQVGNLETPDKCDNCHGGYNRAVEPSFNWRGSMMGNASRDPLFWATLAVVGQDFDGAGDLCIRCHSTSGWYGGRSTPTDGSRLTAGDADGVDCDTCHKMTNPDNSEHLGVMISPFLAHDRGTPATGYYGSGMLSLWPNAHKLGPYSNADARHQFLQSRFHRDIRFCGSCHDVSYPVTGDVAHNYGAQLATGVVASGDLNSPLTAKAAFNNFPYQYGIVERTFSEFMAGGLSRTPVASYGSLPADLKAGAIRAVGEAGANYADGTPRFFSCQTCHMRAVTGAGCNKAGAPVRPDLPLHDMTGGNVWTPDAILYQNSRGLLRLGGGLTTVQIDALRAGKDRALQQLKLAAALSVSGNTLRIVNHTGHRLITGYPEGRRMWANVQWYDSAGALLREDGRYGAVASINGTPVQSIVDLAGSNTKIYEAHYGMTKERAQQLISLGYPADLPLAFDRATGAVTKTLGQLATGSEPYADTFHFVLNNTVTRDNRIPPYGFDAAEARKRNALPVPETLYRNADGTCCYWDELALNPPAGAAYARIRLLYQPTSWEYVQFLYLANRRTNAFLANEGQKLLDTWLAAGMAEPVVMAETTWGTAPQPACTAPGVPQNLTATAGRKSITLNWQPGNPAPAGGYRVYYDQAGKLQLRAEVSASTTSYRDSGLTSRVTYTYVVTAFNRCGTEIAESAPSSKASATAQ
jgi:hypothetical protein